MSSIYREWAQRKRSEAEDDRRAAAQMSLREHRERFLKHAETLDQDAADLELMAAALQVKGT
jgi:hypothetical protein